MTITLPNYPVPDAISRDHRQLGSSRNVASAQRSGSGQSSFANDGELHGALFRVRAFELDLQFVSRLQTIGLEPRDHRR